jgi:hypothetical protein
MIGTVEQFKNESLAVKAIVPLRCEFNSHDARLRARLLTLPQLVEHYKQRDLTPRQRMEDAFDELF